MLIKYYIILHKYLLKLIYISSVIYESIVMLHLGNVKNKKGRCMMFLGQYSVQNTHLTDPFPNTVT